MRCIKSLNMPHPAQAVSDIHHYSLLWDPIHINEWDLYGSGSIEVYLNLLNAAFQLFSASEASAHALCWHSSNPLL